MASRPDVLRHGGGAFHHAVQPADAGCGARQIDGLIPARSRSPAFPSSEWQADWLRDRQVHPAWWWGSAR